MTDAIKAESGEADLARFYQDCSDNPQKRITVLKARDLIKAALSQPQPSKQPEPVDEPTDATGAKTEGVIRRDGYHIDLTWIRHGVERRRRLYDPLLTPLYPALADLLVYALEDLQPHPSQQAEGWTGSKCPTCKGSGERNSDPMGPCPDCGGTGDEWGILAPSQQAGTEERDRDLFERLDEILIEESPMHPFGCATWEESSRIAIDMAKDRIRALASPATGWPSREEVARIIAPEFWTSWEGFPLGQNEALTKADDILALFHPGDTPEGEA